ncbi:MAG: sulfotransferase, partial [Candidatus Hydrothermae bacterium]|nr:sulfotransferase [Candidatus Hydrothermae bacterium]
MDAFERAKQYVSKENYMEIKYEDLCSSPEDVFKKVLEFCELEYTSDFERAIKKYNLKNTNYKWQRD